MAPRILVLYGTTDGQTGKIAFAVGDALTSAGAVAEVLNARDARPGPDPRAYAGVIVAASVHAGGYQRSVKRWVAVHAAALPEKPTAFLSVCLGVLEKNPETNKRLNEIRDGFFAATGWKPGIFKAVAGALPYTHYGWLKRRMMKRIVSKVSKDTDTTRDYEYTDWADLRAFAVEFARRIVTPAPPVARTA